MSVVSPPRPNLPRRSGITNCGRSGLARIVWIHSRLGTHRRANAVSLARELEVSPRTIKRDVEFMRYELGAEIIWEPLTQSYFYERPCELLPLLRLNADEALALVLAGHTFSAWRGSPLGRALNAALGKIAGVVGGSISFPADEIASLVFQPEAPEADAENRFFAKALEAIRARRELRIHYRKPGARADEERAIHPLHLAFLDHRWVLVAYDPARQAARNFLVARIRQASSGSRFEPPANFNLQAYLRGSLGRFTGNKEMAVRLRFDAVTAPYVRERPWHSSQTIEELPGGGLEAVLQVNHLTDVQRRVLACGSHVEVIAPAKLRKAVHAEASAMAIKHRSL